MLASLPERRIRELNDTINKLIKEKVRWERRIMDLGGANHFVRSLVEVLAALVSLIPSQGFFQQSQR
jgi:hypothetical protein